MNRLYFLVFLFSVSIITFNCQKEISFSGMPGNQATPVTATVQGNIVDENGDPVAGATIRVGAKVVTTNAKGYFRITNAPLDKYASLVTAESNGYFKAFRSFCATNGTNYIKIRLIPRIMAGSVDASAGGTVSIANGASVALPANGIVRANGGTAYSGAVRVYLASIDPTADDISEAVPGSFMGNDRNDKRVTLASFGMLAVELESPSGEKLQIADHAAASITTPIPASLQATAPASIPLWYIDEKTGIWKEEGSATKNGDNYTGEVKHFSFWNCDMPFPVVMLSATFKTTNGLPLVHALISISFVVNGTTNYGNGYTDSLGQVSGLVPSNINLQLDVLDPCHGIVYTQPLGSLGQNTNLGIITVANPLIPSMINITGVVKNCNGQPVTDGYALVHCENSTYYAGVNSNGVFNMSFLRCSGTTGSVEVTGVDVSSQTQGTPLTLPITGANMNIGDISACGVSTVQWINYTLDGTNYSMSTTASDSFFTYQGQGPVLTTTTYARKSANGNKFDFNFSHAAGTGTFPMGSLRIHNFDTVTLVQPFNIILTDYAASAGQFYTGTLSGQFTVPGNPFPVHTLTGSFRLRRNY